MEELILKIMSKEIYLFGLLAAFIIGGVLKDQGYFARMYQWTAQRFQSKRVVLGIMSALGGVMPVEGRCSVSAPILDSMVDSQDRSKMGLVDYVSTHHYYLWSPIEPAVIIFMAALGISWMEFMQATIIPLLVYVGFLVVLIGHYVKESDINFHIHTHDPDIPESSLSPWMALILVLTMMGLMLYDPKLFAFWITFPILAVLILVISKTTISKALSYVQWKTLALVAVIIAIGTYMKTFHSDLVAVIEQADYTLLALIPVGMLFAFMLGSSSKYAGFGAAMLSVTNPVYLPVVVISEYVGYLLSPVHKCLFISKSYFQTSLVEVYKYLIPLCILLMAAGGFTYLLLT